uniref:Uncharacterized protein n=1 Tax=Pseudomonas fluorescens (strain SBW25) TaxID=216595 RepID=A0A0G4E5A8_PSEFS|nr:hypothetical protein [Pseudomonas fluorescens]CEK42359.1 hypothetical protein PQBR57_0406 [Pseudomonas fluorescens SBW25]
MTAQAGDTDNQPMETLFWVELVCASCKDTTSGGWASRQIPVRAMKKEAAVQGWAFSGKHAYCSEKCFSTRSAK